MLSVTHHLVLASSWYRPDLEALLGQIPNGLDLAHCRHATRELHNVG